MKISRFTKSVFQIYRTSSFGVRFCRFGTDTQYRKNYYKILGVPPNSSPQEIKNAYIRLSKQYHPDVAGNDVDSRSKFVEITEAFSILGKESNRKEYDFQRRINAFSGIEMGYQIDYPKPDALDPKLVAAYEEEMRRRWNEKLMDWMRGQGEYELERGHHMVPVPANLTVSYSSSEISKYTTVLLTGFLLFSIGLFSIFQELKREAREDSPRIRAKTVVT
nr:dnaj subfamily c [Hymenolepis microstoma]